MNLSKNIPYLFIAMFFRRLIFAYVIERLFALERGMTVQLVVYTEVIYAVTVILLAVIAGVLADKFGRKRLIVLGMLFSCFEYGILIFAQGFLLFGISALIAGFGGAAKSGTWNALLYDSLLSCGRQNEFEKILGRMQAVELTAALIAGFSGAFLAQWFGFAFNYWLSTGSAFIALLFTLKLVEPPKSLQETAESKAKFKEIISAAYVFFRTHPDVLRIVIHVAVVASVVNYLGEFWQVYLQDVSFPIVLFGFVSAALTLIQMPGALLAAKLLSWFSHKTLIAAASFLAAAGVMWAAYVQHASGILGMMAVCFAIALIEPIAAGYLHRRADPKARATIESKETMMEFVFVIGVGLVFGYLSTQFSIFTGFWMLGFVAVIASLVFSMFRLKA